MAYLRISLSDEWDHGERPKAVCVMTRDGDQVVYVPERTCRAVFGECTECRYPLYDGALYCAHCGARVIEDDA